MSFLTKGQEALQSEMDNVLARFRMMGAEFVDVPTLLPAGKMLDLYGEDIRNRAYIVHDNIGEEFLLRPDFTVPIVEAHLERDMPRALYAYSGRVWRQRRYGARDDRHSFWQLGVECFDQNNRAQNDAEIFALAFDMAALHGFEVKTGDLGLAFSLLDQMNIPDWRRDALKRQFWRPNAFDRLLMRYAQPGGKYENLASDFPAPVIGLRTEAMIRARIERLNEEAHIAPIDARDLEALRAVLEMSGTLKDVEMRLAKIADGYAPLAPAAEEFAKRNAALAALGVDLSVVRFDAGFGRETMEYYDGFVFAFYAGDVSVIAGGRYDHLAQSFGAKKALSAVGMAYRPELFFAQGAGEGE